MSELTQFNPKNLQLPAGKAVTISTGHFAYAENPFKIPKNWKPAASSASLEAELLAGGCDRLPCQADRVMCLLCASSSNMTVPSASVLPWEGVRKTGPSCELSPKIAFVPCTLLTQRSV